jgi:hypothetical protein
MQRKSKVKYFWCTARIILLIVSRVYCNHHRKPTLESQPPYLDYLEQISYELEKIRQIRSRAVAVPYFAITVTTL